MLCLRKSYRKKLPFSAAAGLGWFCGSRRHGRKCHCHSKPVGQPTRITEALSENLRSTWKSLGPWGYVALPRSSAVPVEARGFPSLSLCRKLLLCFAHPFQAVGTGAGETTKHKNAAQVSPGCSMVLQREQRRQLTAKEIWAWD